MTITTERLDALEALANRARQSFLNTEDDATEEFYSTFSPRLVLDLVAEIRRLQSENEELQADALIGRSVSQ